MVSWLAALALGLIQGVLEWLPVSSEGAVTVALTTLGSAPEAAIQFGLFLHGGTAVAAAAFYRERLASLLGDLSMWRPSTAFDADTARLSFLGVATAASVLTGGVSYLLLEDVASALSGGAVVALIGLLLIGTGLLQRLAADRAVGAREHPSLLDALVVGSLQGVAVLPGVSRSGTTVSALLLAGHDGETSLELSFLLSIPAAAGAAAVVLLDVGVPSVDPGPAALAVAVSAVVGYLTVGALVALVRRVAFWGVCVGFGALAVVGGLLVAL
jgi:undecaprenyl-diphosphatase